MNLFFKKLIISGVLLIIFAFTFFISSRMMKDTTLSLETRNEAGEYLIELHEDGFYPKELTINLGEVVKFTTLTGRPFWPASDFHPIHTIYPEFDPKNPISPNESWSFKFEKIGKWRLHDHLAPYYTGIINVVDGDNVDNLDCTNLDKNNDKTIRDRCWNEMLFQALDDNGVKGAMQTLKKLYETSSVFTENGCHNWAHVIGDMAFDRSQYKENNIESWDFPIETTYCGYGFFHGVFEHFFRAHPDVKLAQKICNHLTDTLGKEIPRIRQTCFHGIGHGFMPEPPPVKIWGDPFAMMTKALQVCDSVSPTNNEEENMECREGAFNVMANWMSEKKYGLKMNEEEPLQFCNDQKEKKVAYACFYEFGMRITNYAKDDLVKIARDYIKPSYDIEISKMIIDSAAASLLERHLSDTSYNYLVKECLQIPIIFKESCLSGLSGGFLAHGDPGQEYIKAIELCNSKELSESDKNICFNSLVHKFTMNYPKEKIDVVICPLLPARFQHYCK